MRTYVGLVLTVFALMTAACSRSASADQPAASGKTASAEKRYPLTGEVLRVTPEAHSLRVRHDPIKGLMPAMTMDFAVSEADLKLVKVGDRIRGDLVPVPDGDFRLERIFIADKVADDTVADAARRLREDTQERGRKVYREVGEKAPAFALYDQNGRVVQFERYRGKQIMLNFIYTRCPVATMCPAATEKMRATQRLAREAQVKNLELISITLDPAYDTPGILKQYAEGRNIDTSNFTFLTGPEPTIKDLLAQFGVIAEFQGDLINHTLTTLLINEDGKIAHRADGSQWEPKEFVARMHKS
ncbi:SCO family protein [Opitutus sp. ER46]|uniref:SCO family protein n=1 Tax=Opitutus sp. ER46 TaxID=2161864 RepID=UPI000D324B30|nr:SCO family protein [Opitutus sp. ER46]PTX96376.1 electron transporter SenC [Opitutus sp. ER46]